MKKSNFSNYEVGSLGGYVSKDGMWAAVRFGKKFMIIHNGQQLDVFNTLKQAVKYIQKNQKDA